MLRFISLLAGASIALAQQYSISTVAGGAPPATPAAAASVSMGQPGRVAIDASGNLYFSSSNCVFKINGGGTVTLVAGTSRAGFSGDGGLAVNARLNAPQGIAFDAAGNIYIADSRNNRVRQVSPSGIITTFAGNGVISPGGGPSAYGDGGPATSAQLHLPMGVAVDTSGNVYIADTGDNTIREVTTDGNIATIAGDSFASYQGDAGLAIKAELHGPEDVAVDSSGNIYIADTGNAYVRKVTTDGNINYIAGDGTIGFSGDGGYATSAALVAPFALAVDSSGNVYFAENGDSRIRKIDAKSLDISTVAGNGTPGFTGDGSTAISAELNSPTGVAVDSAGNLYIADSLNCRIRKVASGGSISTFAGNGTLSYSGDGSAASQAQLNSPQGVAADAAGNLYLADTLNNVVRKVSPNGTISNFAGNGGAGSSGDGSAATSAQLHGPQGLAVDASGNLFIADTMNAKVRKVSANGVITTVAGSGTPGYGGDGGAAASAQLNLPMGVAVDSSGNLYIADFGNSRVRKVSASGAIISTVAGNGTAGYSGDGGPAVKAQLTGPQGVAVDAAGNLYIADTENNLIREVTLDGLIATAAGNGIAGYSGDGGQATNAQVGNPVGVAVDAAGNIYIVDASTRVRQVYPNGLIVTIAGNGSRGYTGDGGLATQAQLDAPSAIAVGKNGNLYVADMANNAVRLLQYAGNGLGVNAVTNAASNLSGPVAPGEVVVVYGSGLGPARLAQYQLDPTSGLVGTNLAGTSVIFGGTPGPVLYTSATQIGVVAPYSIAGSNVQVFVQYQGQTSAPVTLPVAPVAPALFTQDSSGKGQAAASNQDGTLNGASHPAKVGSYISLWLTGAGHTNPAGVDGMPGAAPLPKPVAPVAVTIGGQVAVVQYAGQAPSVVAGVMQINAQIPSGIQAGNAVPVVVQVGSVSTQAGVTVAVSGN
jgi:uncharacterized protein (TIGR03437 family)